ncbi:hypothetical protein PR202_gb02307 [Eleusine coracana subsp. coracana]|uniref:Uncharacterized protein n=1 Tax=Eleusine coracana subsp. coracana TaxID=191504 RepID=A0AAV5DYU5_ELECO|nr:hypothetical protein PR202_gb02307 [Eleusine coracana subsp. coracana]
MMSRSLVKWTSGAGARIGCVRDYPAELQSKALEQVNLSPNNNKAKNNSSVSFPSPRPSPQIRMSPRLQLMGQHHHCLAIRPPTVHLTLPNNKNRT